MLHRVILAGLATCVFALTFGFSQTANAGWFDSATGQPVQTIPLSSDPNDLAANVNAVRASGGHHADVGGKSLYWAPCPPPSETAGFPPSTQTDLRTSLFADQPVLVLGGNLGGGWSRNSYSDFSTFDGSGAGGGVYGVARYYIQPGFYVGPEAGFMLLDVNARNPDSAFGIVRTDAYLGGQAGVTLQGPGASKVNIYTGLDADWSRITVGVSDANERMSKTLGGWSVHGGVEVQPVPSIPTMWLGLDLRHSDVSGTIGGDPTHVRWNMLTVTLSIQH